MGRGDQLPVSRSDWELVANGRIGTDVGFELNEVVTLYNSVFICVFVNLSNDDIGIRFSGGCDV